jgi:hypothetical protein
MLDLGFRIRTPDDFALPTISVKTLLVIGPGTAGAFANLDIACINVRP